MSNCLDLCHGTSAIYGPNENFSYYHSIGHRFLHTHRCTGPEEGGDGCAI